MLRALYVAYVVVALFLAGSMFLENVPRRVVPALAAYHGDGLVDAWGGRAFLENWNPYSAEGLKRAAIERYGFGHPPTTPFWFIPLVKYNPVEIHQITGHLSILLVFIQLLILGLELRAPAPMVTALLALAAMISQQWFQDHLQMVQLGIPIAFFYTLAWYFLRRGNEIAGGAAIGLSLTFKLFPGLMLLFLAMTRRWRALVAAVGAWGAIAALMTWRYGLVCWPQYFKMQPSIANDWMSHIKNSSLQGVLLRLFWPACKPKGPVVPAATWIAILGSLLLLALFWRLVRRARTPESVDGPFALFAVGSVFLNAWVWEHYYVLLPLPLAIAVAELRRARSLGMKPWQVVLGAATGAGVIAMLAIDIRRKEQVRAISQEMHRKLHLLEIANWLPWLVTIVLLAWLVWWHERRRSVIS